MDTVVSYSLRCQMFNPYGFTLQSNKGIGAVYCNICNFYSVHSNCSPRHVVHSNALQHAACEKYPHTKLYNIMGVLPYFNLVLYRC